MELDVNGKVIAKPTADDIVDALDAKSFPREWYITLDAESGASLDAVRQADGTFTLAHIDQERRRDAVPNVDAARLKSTYLKFLGGDPHWQGECIWHEAPAKRAAMKFVPDIRPLTGRGGNEPPTWAVVVMIGIVGVVILTFNLGQWEDGSYLRSVIPFADTSYFWVGLIALPMVALVVLAAASKMIDLRKASTWTQTTGRVVRSQMETRRHRFAGEAEKVENVPVVEYEFKAGGRTVRGSRIGIGDDAGGANTAATLARYPAGAEVAVFYDPADPRNCVLEREGPQGVTAAGCARAFLVLALFAGAVYWLIAYGPAFIEARFPHAESGIVIFAGGFGLALLLFFIAARRTSKQAAKWPSVRGQIVKSEVESFRKRVGNSMTTLYRPAVEFAYSVGGREYRANKIMLMTEVSGTQSYAEQMVAKYPADAAVDVHYDPADPSNAALENPTGATWIVAVLALACFALAFWELGIFQ